MEVGRVTGSPTGEPAFFWMAEMYFADRARLDAAMASPEKLRGGQGPDAVRARELLTLLVVEIE